VTADAVQDEPKPFWVPEHSLLAAAQALDVQLATNWPCVLQEGEELRPFNAGSVWLQDAVLTEQDVAMLSRLRLDPAKHSPLVCAIFASLMQALPAAQRPGGRIQSSWVELLLCLVPPCDHGSPVFNSVAACADRYIERGQAPLLLPLYMLLLRGNTWISRIQRHIYGRFQQLKPMPYEGVNDYNLQELIGDPCSTAHTTAGRWTEELMEAREIFFSTYEVDGVRNRSIQDLLFTLEVMVHVVASCSALESRIAYYSYWTRQL